MQPPLNINWNNPKIEQLSRIEDSDHEAIGQFCTLWAAKRLPDYTALLTTRHWVARTGSLEVRVLTALKVEQYEIFEHFNKRLIRALVKATDDTDAEISHRARDLLETVPHNMIGVLVDLWVETRALRLWGELYRRYFLPDGPPLARVLLALSFNRGSEVRNAPVELIVQAAQDADTQIAHAALYLLYTIRHPSQQALCRIIIEQDLPDVEKVALEAGYLPADPYHKVLYYFVTGQWERYEALDFDQRILRAAYQTANPALKRRLVVKIRQAGRTDYLKILTGEDYQVRLDTEEMRVLLQVLRANEEWGRLWLWVFELPLATSSEVVGWLIKADWRPQPADQAVFDRLCQLRRAGLLTDPKAAQMLLPPAILKAQANIHFHINDLAISSDGTRVALATSKGRLVVWNAALGRLEGTYGRAGRSVGKVVYTPQDQLVWAELTHDPNKPSGILTLREGQSHLLGQHQGEIVSLLTVGPDQVLSASQGGEVALWDVNQARLLTQIQLPEGITLAIANPGTQKVVAFHTYRVTFLNLPDLTVVEESYFSVDTSSAWAAFVDDAPCHFVIGNRNGIAAYKKQSVLNLGLMWKPYNGSLRSSAGLIGLPHLRKLISLEQYRKITFAQLTQSEDGAPVFIMVGAINFIDTYSGVDASLAVSVEADYLAMGDAKGHIMLWDIRVQQIWSLFEQPISQGQPAQLSLIQNILHDQRLELRPEMLNSLHYLYECLTHHYRYAIELEEEPTFVSEFDIELEES